jgi:hypothetical protein
MLNRRRIFDAVHDGDSSLCLELLENKASLDGNASHTSSYECFTPLIAASDLDRPGVFQTLLNAGAGIDVVDTVYL